MTDVICILSELPEWMCGCHKHANKQLPEWVNTKYPEIKAKWPGTCKNCNKNWVNTGEPLYKIGELWSCLECAEETP